ncbi:MAG: hypothetical protein DYG89_40790 [Caldilinea sp. CFX5]|nr:hypothetical protein [Caldilinea sp. CFX5]
MEPKPKKLLDQVRDVLRPKNYAYSTEKTYVDWIELTGYIDAVWAERDKRLPVVLTKAEVQLVIGKMTGLHQMMAKLLYGSGIRLM